MNHQQKWLLVFFQFYIGAFTSLALSGVISADHTPHHAPAYPSHDEPKHPPVYHEPPTYPSHVEPKYPPVYHEPPTYPAYHEPKYEIKYPLAYHEPHYQMAPKYELYLEEPPKYHQPHGVPKYQPHGVPQYQPYGVPHYIPQVHHQPKPKKYVAFEVKSGPYGKEVLSKEPVKIVELSPYAKH